jgi:hypothetical protein
MKVVLNWIAIFVSLIMLPAISANAVTLSMNVGTLQVGVPNNEFLASAYSSGDGFIQPNIYFYSSAGQSSSGDFGEFYKQSENFSYTFNYFFDLNSDAWVAPNPIYLSGTIYGPASAVLMQGANVVATATSFPGSGFGLLLFPTMYLAANTQYELSVTEFGPLEIFAGNTLISQIALDILPVPEPAAALMFTVGLAALGLRHTSLRSKRRIG